MRTDVMAPFAADHETKDELEDLHHGLHLVMENLTNQKNYGEAECILRIIDARLAYLIQSIKLVR